MAGKNVRSGILAGCGLAAVALTAGQAKGIVISPATGVLYRTGFEASEGFTAYPNPNLLSGQPVGATPATGQFTDYGGGTNRPAAGLITQPGGNQIVQISDAATSAGGFENYYPATYSPNDGGVAYTVTGGNVDIRFSLAVLTGAANTLGTPVFGVSAYGGGAVAGDDAPIASLLINASDGSLFPNAGAVVVPGFTAASGVFNSYDLQLNYATQTYSVFQGLGDATPNLLETGAFQTTGLTSFEYGALTSINEGTGPGTGSAAFDNYSVTVPEPTTASIVVGGLALAAGGRRRRRSVAR